MSNQTIQDLAYHYGIKCSYYKNRSFRLRNSKNFRIHKVVRNKENSLAQLKEDTIYSGYTKRLRIVHGRFGIYTHPEYILPFYAHPSATTSINFNLLRKNTITSVFKPGTGTPYSYSESTFCSHNIATSLKIAKANK